MIIYFDENLPKHLAEGFQILQSPEALKTGIPVEVKYIPTEFNKGIKDFEWIPIAAKQKACVITQDISISRRKHELELLKKHGLGIFFLRGASKKRGMSVWQMVEVLSKNWPDIVNKGISDKRPFAYEVKLKGKIKRVT